VWVCRERNEGSHGRRTPSKPKQKSHEASVAWWWWLGGGGGKLHDAGDGMSGLAARGAERRNAPFPSPCITTEVR
jgi:hypothetical protein